MVVIYTRYSTDLQSKDSCEDQENRAAVSHDIVDFLFENSTIRPADSNGANNLNAASFQCQICDSFWLQTDFVELRYWRFRTMRTIV